MGPETVVKLNQQILGRQLFPTLHIVIFNHSHIYPPVLSVALFAPSPSLNTSLRVFIFPSSISPPNSSTQQLMECVSELGAARACNLDEELMPPRLLNASQNQCLTHRQTHTYTQSVCVCVTAWIPSHEIRKTKHLWMHI